MFLLFFVFLLLEKNEAMRDREKFLDFDGSHDSFSAKRLGERGLLEGLFWSGKEEPPFFVFYRLALLDLFAIAKYDEGEMFVGRFTFFLFFSSISLIINKPYAKLVALSLL